jgi:Transglycosylase SLT domain
MSAVTGRGLVGVVVVALAVLLVAAPAAAVEVTFPLTIEYDLLRSALRKHLRDTGGELVLWRSADGCRTAGLSQPTVTPAGGRLLIAGPGSVRAALGLLGYCWGQVGWDGQVEILARPEIGPDWQVRLRDLDIQLYDANRQQTGIVPRVFESVKGWVEAELATFAFSLGNPVNEIRGLLGAVGGGPRGPLNAALQTLRPVAVAVEPDAVKVTMALDLPAAPPVARGPEPALTPAQLKRWHATLDQWDSFVVFVIKDLGVFNTDPTARNELLDLLLSSRHELMAVASRGPEAGTDPVRRLFLSVWNRLRAIVRRSLARTGEEGQALRFTTFLAAGDALAAVESAAPSLGIEISADGLRRLARVLAPTYSGDPLEYTDLPDSTLRQIFRFRDPDAPPRRPRRKPAGSSWWWLGPRPAFAQAGDDEWVMLGRRLDRWVPAGDQMPTYRMTVARLLTVAAERSLDPDNLHERFDDLYYHLVKAVAWQESCWRQFLRKGDTVTFVFSSTGDVGLMQINVRVWRGFFSPDKLRWNAAYNAGAGAEILIHHLIRYGVPEARERMEDAARATYAAYNGGPTRLRRFRQSQTPPAIQAIDRGFWEKYRAVAGGAADARVLCLPPGVPS